MYFFEIETGLAEQGWSPEVQTQNNLIDIDRLRTRKTYASVTGILCTALYFVTYSRDPMSVFTVLCDVRTTRNEIHVIFHLCISGADIPVTAETRKQFVELVIKYVTFLRLMSFCFACWLGGTGISFAYNNYYVQLRMKVLNVVCLISAMLMEFFSLHLSGHFWLFCNSSRTRCMRKHYELRFGFLLTVLRNSSLLKRCCMCRCWAFLCIQL